MSAPASRDDINVAFKQSNYPTPYGDSTIAGSKPHHPPPPRLGRAYADQHACSLNAALIAPGREGVTAEEEVAAAAAVAASNGEARRRVQVGKAHVACGASDEATTRDRNTSVSRLSVYAGQAVAGNSRVGGEESLVVPGGGAPRPCLRASEHYILNVKNGGRRHFDEPRSQEAVWRPSMRRLTPDPSAGREHPRGKGQGIFNMDEKASLHPVAHAALERREADKRRREAGKAMVVCPPNHSPRELGLWVPEHFGRRADSTGNSPDVPPQVPDILVVETATDATPSSAPKAVKPQQPSSSEHLWGSPGRAAAVDALAPAAPPRPAFDVAASREAGKVAMGQLTATRKAQTAQRTRSDDVQAVRRLPDI